MAGQLRQGWNQTIWGRVAKLLAGEAPIAPAQPRTQPSSRQRQIRLRPEQIDALVADYQTGTGVVAVARKYGICVKTASAHLTRHGIDIRQRHSIPAEQLEEALRLRDEGWSYQQLGDRYDCCRTTVSTALRATRRSDESAT